MKEKRSKKDKIILIILLFLVCISIFSLIFIPIYNMKYTTHFQDDSENNDLNKDDSENNDKNEDIDDSDKDETPIKSNYTIIYKWFTYSQEVIYAMNSVLAETSMFKTLNVDFDDGINYYYLLGWDIDGDNIVDELPTTITQDYTFTAIYSEPKFVVTFYSDSKIHYQFVAEPHTSLYTYIPMTWENPVKEADSEYSYTFYCWLDSTGQEVKQFPLDITSKLDYDACFLKTALLYDVDKDIKE